MSRVGLLLLVALMAIGLLVEGAMAYCTAAGTTTNGNQHCYEKISVPAGQKYALFSPGKATTRIRVGVQRTGTTGCTFRVRTFTAAQKDVYVAGGGSGGTAVGTLTNTGSLTAWDSGTRTVGSNTYWTAVEKTNTAIECEFSVRYLSVLPTTGLKWRAGNLC